MHLPACELTDTAATLRLLHQLVTSSQVRTTQNHDKSDTDVAKGRVDGANQGLETEEAQSKTNQHRHDEYQAETLRSIACQAATQRVEHTDGGIENHGVDDDRHHRTQNRVNFIDNCQSRHILVANGLDLEEEGKGHQRQQTCVNGAAHETTDASFTRVQVATANDDGHRYGHHHAETNIVQGRNRPVRQRGRQFSGVLRGLRHRSIGGEQSVDTGSQQEHDNEWSDHANHAADLVGIQHAYTQSQCHHDDGADPHLKSELLIQVRTGTGEHDEAGTEQRDHHGDVQNLRNPIAGDYVEDLGVLISLQVTGN